MWIKSSDGAPPLSWLDVSEECLLFCTDGFIRIGRFGKDGCMIHYRPVYCVTHWQPLPAPPEPKESK